MNKNVIYHWINREESLTPDDKIRIVNFTGAEKLWNASSENVGDLLKASGLCGEGLIRYFSSEYNRELSIKELEEYGKKGIRTLGLSDTAYPEGLKYIDVPPVCIYVIGKLPDITKSSVAIVGTRKSTDYGIRIAEYFGSKCVTQVQPTEKIERMYPELKE